VPETAKSPRVGCQGQEHGIAVVFPGFQKNLVVFFEEGHFPALVVEAIEIGEDKQPLWVLRVSEHKPPVVDVLHVFVKQNPDLLPGIREGASDIG